MTDILVQNAIADVSNQIRASSQKVNYVDAFGITLKDKVKALIISNASLGPYTQFATGGASAYLCDLSDYSKISLCQCNFAGAATNYTAQSNTENPWTNGTVLKGAATAPDQTSVSTRIRGLDSVLNNIWNEAQTQTTLDIYLAYVALKDTFVAENNNPTLLLNWYGIGLSPNVQGARLSSTNFRKICGAGWTCGEGATCTWTVPAGATQAKFQLWGAGQGSNPGCCCGGAPFGATGSYAEMVINVTPGAQYSICAGCSCQRSCCSNESVGCGCASGVTGPGICCLFASGTGCYISNCNNLNWLRIQTVGGACRRFQNPYCTDSGPCWCSNNEYCYSNSCATCGVVPVYPAYCESGACSCATLTACVKDGPQLVVCGIHGGGCLETNNYGYHTRPPVINADTGLLFCGGCTVQTFSSGTTCGGCNGFQWGTEGVWHPGHGGAGTHVMGGDNTHKGDYGRAGMVQVSWI